MHRRVLCAWLPNWPCQRMLQNDRSLIGQPFVLQVRDPRRGLIVAAASSLARESGITPGMSISEANSMIVKGTLVLLDHDLQEDLDALCWLVDAAQQFSPMVGIETLSSKIWGGRSLLQPQSILLDATHLGPIFGGELSMAEQVQLWLEKQGLCSCIAIADSVGAAWALANYRNRSLAAQALLHQNQHGPNQHEQSQHEQDQQEEGLTLESRPTTSIPKVPPIVVSKEETRSLLRNFPVESLRIELGTAQALRRLGIQKLESLLQLPRHGLATRLGTHLMDRIDQAWELHEEPIASLHGEAEFTVELPLEHATDRRPTLEEIVRRLTLQLCERLVARGRGALRVLCRFDGVRSVPIVLQLGMFRATAEVEHLTSLLLGQFDQQWERAIEIQKVTLQATLTGELTWQQPDLFEVEQVVHRETISRLVDGLSCRLGRKAVVTPQLHRDPQPELACSWRPLTGRRVDGSQQETSRKLSRRSPQAEPRIEDPLRRPLTLIQPPKPMEVLAIHPHGPPIRFSVQKKMEQVVRYWGPERIESGWWRGPSQRRDYYRVETEEGRWLWLYRQLTDGQWFLHGEFD